MVGGFITYDRERLGAYQYEDSLQFLDPIENESSMGSKNCGNRAWDCCGKIWKQRWGTQHLADPMLPVHSSGAGSAHLPIRLFASGLEEFRFAEPACESRTLFHRSMKWGA